MWLLLTEYPFTPLQYYINLPLSDLLIALYDYLHESDLL